MWKSNLRTFAIVSWLALVALIVIGGVLTGVRPAPSTLAFLLVTWLAPPVLLMMVWRGAPPPTIAEVISGIDRRQRGTR